MIGVRRQAQITLPGVERMIELKHLSEVLYVQMPSSLSSGQFRDVRFFTHREFALMKQDSVRQCRQRVVGE
ncbi:MAG: hypothetical protein ACLVJ6_11060 [Merdibacter sp.]